MEPVWQRFAPQIVVVLAVATLGTALVSQYGFGLQPCELCLMQRWPYVAAIVLGLLGSLVFGRARAVFVALAGLAFLVTAGIGVFHVGVEQHWWPGLASCSGGSTAASVDELRAQLMGKPIVRCDDIAFQFLGVSMAGWNVVAGVAWAVFSFIAAKRLWRV